jgi:release factor glutamine methyltransferase
MVSRRVAGEPVEAIVGWAAFHGLRIVVAPGVFVPRRRTELLVREAISIVQWQLVGISPDRQPIPTGLPIVELCCGTAAVATAIRSGVSGELEVHAADLDPAATACARENLGEAGHVHTGDLYDALPTNLRGRIDLLVANAPYVPSAEIAMMPPEARDHEPRVALDGGADGLDVQRRIIDLAREWLAPGGHLLVETSRRQAPSTVASCAAAGLAAQVVTDDELDATVVVAVAP